MLVLLVGACLLLEQSILLAGADELRRVQAHERVVCDGAVVGHGRGPVVLHDVTSSEGLLDQRQKWKWPPPRVEHDLFDDENSLTLP